MLTLSRMKSILTLTSPKFITIAPFSVFSNSHLRNVTLASSPLGNRSFLAPTLYLTNSRRICLSSSSYCHSRGLCTDTNVNSGEIHVIVGPMFAGKTTTLLQRMKLASSNGSNVAIIKSNKDTRYGLYHITTHDGARLPCLPVGDLSSVREQLGAEAYDKLEVIGIDEAQFFGDLYDFCREAADHDGKTVIVAGLDGDYLRRSFGSVLDIIPIADTVTKLTARCEVCGQHAVFTLRKTADMETELIAGADVYMPVCRKHYMSGQVVKEATLAVLESQNAEVASVL